MTTPISPKRWRNALGNLLRPLDLESGLLLCNDVLAGWRDEPCSRDVGHLLDDLGQRASPFVVHLAAREILRHGLGRSARQMVVEDFKRVVDSLWYMLDQDPILHDPGWLQSDPTGFFIRYVGLQDIHNNICLQHYGLASSLFTNALPQLQDESLDVAAHITHVLGMSPEQFMRLGFVAATSRMASRKATRLPGTITTAAIPECKQFLGDDFRELWPRFLNLASASVTKFKEECVKVCYPPRNREHQLYHRNLLRTYPLIETREGHFVAPDAGLVHARTTLGLYYDALEASGKTFTDAFGPRFSNVVGELLRSACGKDRVWSESQLDMKIRSSPPSKNADHAILGRDAHVLVECKALRPNQQLLMLGSYGEVAEIVNRITGAVQQLTHHSMAIENDRWSKYGIPTKPCFGLVITYGPIPTVNGVLFRDKVRSSGLAKQDISIQYLVLSINEFDCFLKLIERGHEAESLMKTLCQNHPARFPGPYKQDLEIDAVSSVTKSRGLKILDCFQTSGARRCPDVPGGAAPGDPRGEGPRRQ